MNLSRFLQIVLMRDVITYVVPGFIFLVLLNQAFLQGGYFDVSKFSIKLGGDAASVLAVIAFSYALGYALHHISTPLGYSFRRRLEASPSDLQTIKLKGEVRNKIIERFKLDGVLPDSVPTEIDISVRMEKYIRYICEMEVMRIAPEIHQINIERRSTLRNFELSLGAGGVVLGAIIGSGTILNYFRGTPLDMLLVSSASILLVGGMFLIRVLAPKHDYELKLSIWRCFHLVALRSEVWATGDSVRDVDQG